MKNANSSSSSSSSSSSDGEFSSDDDCSSDIFVKKERIGSRHVRNRRKTRKKPGREPIAIPDYIPDDGRNVATISVCSGKHCSKRGASGVLHRLEASAHEMPYNVGVECCTCLGQCKRGPAVHVKMNSGEEVTCVKLDQSNDVMQLTVAALDDGQFVDVYYE